MGVWVGVEGGQDGCGRKIEVFVKNQKKKMGGGVRGGGSGWGGGQGGCERRIEVFVKIQKKNGGGGGSEEGSGWGGGQGGCDRRIEVFVKIQKKKLGGGVGLVGVDVNAMLGVGGDVVYGDVNQEILYKVQKGIVQY